MGRHWRNRYPFGDYIHGWSLVLILTLVALEVVGIIATVRVLAGR